MQDLLGRRYVIRPVLFSSLLVRIIFKADSLFGLFKQLKEFQKTRHDAVTSEQFHSNITSSCDLIKTAFDTLEMITIDAESLLFRDLKEIPEIYEELIQHLQEDISKLEKHGKTFEKDIELLRKQIKSLNEEKDIKEAEEMLKKKEKAEEHMEKYIESEKKAASTLAEHEKGLLSLLENRFKISDFAARYAERDSSNPEGAIHEFSVRTTIRLIRKIKADGIETKQLHDRIEKLHEEMLKLGIGEMLKEEKDLVEFEKRMLDDAGEVMEFDQILLHRLTHSFLHRIDAESTHHAEWFETVKPYVHGTHIHAKTVLERIRKQTKKLRHEL